VSPAILSWAFVVSIPASAASFLIAVVSNRAAESSTISTLVDPRMTLTTAVSGFVVGGNFWAWSSPVIVRPAAMRSLSMEV
jgi:hypothetical protein